MHRIYSTFHVCITETLHTTRKAVLPRCLELETKLGGMRRPGETRSGIEGTLLAYYPYTSEMRNYHVIIAHNCAFLILFFLLSMMQITK